MTNDFLTQAFAGKKALECARFLASNARFYDGAVTVFGLNIIIAKMVQEGSVPPKVIERVVERVIEKPVTVEKIVEKIVYKDREPENEPSKRTYAKGLRAGRKIS